MICTPNTGHPVLGVHIRLIAAFLCYKIRMRIIFSIASNFFSNSSLTGASTSNIAYAYSPRLFETISLILTPASPKRSQLTDNIWSVVVAYTDTCCLFAVAKAAGWIVDRVFNISIFKIIYNLVDSHNSTVFFRFFS